MPQRPSRRPSVAPPILAGSRPSPTQFGVRQTPLNRKRTTSKRLPQALCRTTELCSTQRKPAQRRRRGESAEALGDALALAQLIEHGKALRKERLAAIGVAVDEGGQAEVAQGARPESLVAKFCVLAQRLAKKLCDCKTEYTPDADEVKLFVTEYAEELKSTTAWKADYAGEAKKLYESWVKAYGQDGRLKFYKANGCDKCNKTGYKGRIGLHELLVADDHIKRLIQERARVAELFAASVETGMRTLKMDGMEKIMMGLTDLKQVRSVCIK